MGETERTRTTREGRAAWAAEIQTALDRRSLSVHAAARLAGIQPGVLQAWMRTYAEPDPRALPELAAIVDVPWLRQVELLGWLPPQLRPGGSERRDAAVIP